MKNKMVDNCDICYHFMQHFSNMKIKKKTISTCGNHVYSLIFKCGDGLKMCQLGYNHVQCGGFNQSKSNIRYILQDF
jgi:hypothetical protein